MKKSVKRQIVTLASDPANMNRIDKNGPNPTEYHSGTSQRWKSGMKLTSKM